MNLDGVEYYYIMNGQGDIIGLYDKDGIQVASYTYNTWGKLISLLSLMMEISKVIIYTSTVIIIPSTKLTLKVTNLEICLKQWMPQLRISQGHIMLSL